MTNNNVVPNRLINEKSPYLLQHAHNPVDWFPWSQEAFEKAKTEDKPIFLSIGYSTCHWCHVMERESFEDEEVANLLNENFVSIKVDREERPDVDNIYMTFCQALTGHGGWPLTIIMTPDQKPFYAGTYFPKKGRMGIPGLMDILDRVINAWRNNKNDLVSSSETITGKISEHFSTGNEKQEVDIDIIHQAYNDLEATFESDYGGFSHAPKFPTPHNLSFLLRYYKKSGEQKALDMVTKTLDSMYYGGIFDHIGFGFSRYSTDKKWLVPHFEKMLYDNALLAIAYSEAYQVTKKQLYADVVKKIFTYILRDMVSPEGGFYSAEDADSEGVEGKFYVWNPKEIKSILGNEDGEKFCNYYGIISAGNFEGRSIPNRIHAGNDGEDENTIDTLREKIFEYREKRIHPYKDDKILTSWNGLMIAAMSIGGRVFNENSYTEVAEGAVKFILDRLVREDGRLLARYREGESDYLGYIDDYAFLVWGLIEIYQTTYNPKYLEYAIKFNSEMIKYFWDEKNGGFFIYGKDGERLIAQPKEVYDGATPSGNSVALSNIIRLAKITGNSKLEDLANEQIKVFGGNIKSVPQGYTHFLMGVMFALESTLEIIIVGQSQDEETQNMLNKVKNSFLPNAVTIFVSEEQSRHTLTTIVPYIKEYKPVKEKATAYVCRNYSCQEPINDIKELGRILN